ncbi:hypothetical protein B0H17DRAFT_1147956 [Mycena rosella]|uniref:Uncharacterized protein n=1 Tax=Mycena rosella TaxID=1033263 RepID=A0AAD7CH08_MYCRO|nr:hypothetical protein B0H17DRAFT_1147956 [Mycena rosella]
MYKIHGKVLPAWQFYTKAYRGSNYCNSHQADAEKHREDYIFESSYLDTSTYCRLYSTLSGRRQVAPSSDNDIDGAQGQLGGWEGRRGEGAERGGCMVSVKIDKLEGAGGLEMAWWETIDEFEAAEGVLEGAWTEVISRESFNEMPQTQIGKGICSMKYDGAQEVGEDGGGRGRREGGGGGKTERRCRFVAASATNVLPSNHTILTPSVPGCAQIMIERSFNDLEDFLPACTANRLQSQYQMLPLLVMELCGVTLVFASTQLNRLLTVKPVYTVHINFPLGPLRQFNCGDDIRTLGLVVCVKYVVLRRIGLSNGTQVNTGPEGVSGAGSKYSCFRKIGLGTNLVQLCPTVSLSWEHLSRCPGILGAGRFRVKQSCTTQGVKIGVADAKSLGVISFVNRNEPMWSVAICISRPSTVYLNGPMAAAALWAKTCVCQF